jgi:PAS domain S-box-containing protein
MPIDTTDLHQSISKLQEFAKDLDSQISERSAELILLNSEIDAAKDLLVDTRQKLADADYMLHSLFSLSGDAIIYVVDDAIKVANSAAAHIFGYNSPEDMIGRSMRSHIDPEFAPIIEDDIAANDFSRWQTPQCLYYIRTDGSKFIGEVTVNVSMKHGQRHAIGIIRDVTEQKTTQNNLYESILRLDAVLRVSQTGVWDWDVQSRTVYCSPECSTMLEYEPGELDSQLSTWEALIHPEERESSVSVYE